jgi:5-methylcytosine-specific restriction endonuclease McrA
MKTVDISGLRHGALVAKEPVGSLGGRRLWLCICDCGKSVELTASAFGSGRSKSCGCRIHKQYKWIGQRHGKWLVTGVVRGFRGKNPTTLLEVVCDCGATAKKPPTDLLRSEGCIACRPHPPGRASQTNYSSIMNRHYERYRLNAANRGYDFALSREEFSELVAKSCFYCNSSPDERTYKKNSAPLGGIDRVNNRMGYTIENSRPCCSTCNRAKGTLKEDDFLRMAKMIYENLKLGGRDG